MQVPPHYTARPPDDVWPLMFIVPSVYKSHLYTTFYFARLVLTQCVLCPASVVLLKLISLPYFINFLIIRLNSLFFCQAFHCARSSELKLFRDNSKARTLDQLWTILGVFLVGCIPLSCYRIQIWNLFVIFFLFFVPQEIQSSFHLLYYTMLQQY